MEKVDSYSSLIAKAQELKVSSEAYLWRLRQLNLIKDTELKGYLSQIKTNWESQKKDKAQANEEFKVSPINTSRGERGGRFLTWLLMPTAATASVPPTLPTS